MELPDNIKIKIVNTKKEALEMVSIRYKTFVKNMNIEFLDEFDGSDYDATNFLLYVDEVAVGTIRYVKEDNNVFRLGRFVVLPEFRKGGLGSTLFKYVENYIKENMPVSKIYFHGMAYLKDFYIKLGYEAIGDKFLEENIPHIYFQKIF